MRRGEVWWANLDEPFGSEPGYRRPVVVVQAQLFNISRLQTTLVAVMTTNLGWSDFPGNVIVAPEVSGLPKTSVVQATQLMTLDMRRFSTHIGVLPYEVMDKIDAGLRLALEL
jgi:mRNA interferase MazF